MTFPDPRSATFEPETLNLLDQVSQTIDELNLRRPFSEEVNTRLSTEFLPDRVTASLNMEGIAVSRRQTLLMMDAMTLSENSSKAEIEIFNALKADEFVYEIAMGKHPLTAGVVREVNKYLQTGILETAGEFRQKDVEITGAPFQPPAFGEVEPLVSELVSTYNQLDSLNPILRAAWLHATFTHIHPFEDGNGRTGRLLQDFSLLCSGLYPTGIPSARRDDYYDALEKADGGDWNPLCQMISEFELNLLSRVKSILDEVQSRGQFISALAKRANERRVGGLHKQFVVWRQRMQNFADQLTTTCEDLNKSSDVLHVRTERYELIDFAKWREISETGRSSNTWLLKQTWFSESESFFRTIFFFRRHYFRPEDIHTRDSLHGNVALRLTGGTPEVGARYDFDGFIDAEVRFREMLYVDDVLHVYSSTGGMRLGQYREEEVWSCSEVTDHSAIVQNFLEDVFVRKLGI